ncbi:hypothetical protein HanRHA438_Chr08g0332641 [Helianthus annuus]|nr:hypothetical protein HanRHA438_Chr08g0332641 [Helianthus annuus]
MVNFWAQRHCLFIYPQPQTKLQPSIVNLTLEVDPSFKGNPIIRENPYLQLGGYFAYYQILKFNI